MAREMKDSGVEWIGAIPVDWFVEKIKFIASFCQEKYREDLGALVYVGLENISSWNGKFIETESEYDRGQSILFSENDILWGKMRPYLAKVFHCQGNGCCSGEFCVIRPRLSIDVRFLWNTLISVGFVSAVDQSTYGTKMPRANADFIKNMIIPIPPSPEQKGIGAFLDQKCKEIDAVLEKTRASIEEYKKLKQAIITQAVTKGVRGDRPMKESGSIWFGFIPADWGICKTKKIVTIEKRIAGVEGLTVLSITQKGIRPKDLSKNEGQLAASYSNYQIVHPGDFAMNHMDLLTGWIDISRFEGVTSPDYRVFTMPVNNGVNKRYYLYLFQMCYFNRIYYGLGQGVSGLGRWRLPANQFLNFLIPVPPIEEQNEIVEYLNHYCTEIDDLIQKKQKFLRELESYRKSLIYEYVTGKKEVPV